MGIVKKIIKLIKSKSKIILNNKKKRLDDFISNQIYIKKKDYLPGWKLKYNLTSGPIQYIKYKKTQVMPSSSVGRVEP